jgi:hypothetical protein
MKPQTGRPDVSTGGGTEFKPFIKNRLFGAVDPAR